MADLTDQQKFLIHKQDLLPVEITNGESCILCHDSLVLPPSHTKQHVKKSIYVGGSTFNACRLRSKDCPLTEQGRYHYHCAQCRFSTNKKERLKTHPCIAAGPFKPSTKSAPESDDPDFEIPSTSKKKTA